MPGTVPGTGASKPIEAERLHWDISKPNRGVGVGTPQQPGQPAATMLRAAKDLSVYAALRDGEERGRRSAAGKKAAGFCLGGRGWGCMEKD